MSTKRPSVTTLSDLIQKYVGSDYDKIVEVSQNLGRILQQSGLTLGVDYSANGFPQETLDQLLNELTATVQQNQIAVDGLAETNEAVAGNTSSISEILATGIFIATLDVGAAAWVLNENDMASNSAIKVPTQRSVRQFAEGLLATSNGFQGGYDASTNIPNLDSRALPTPGAVKKADNWVVETTGTFFGVAIAKGDRIQAIINDPILITDWIVTPAALDANTIATLYEGLPDVNRFDDSAALKLAGIEAGATEDQLASEVPFDDSLLSIVAADVQAALEQLLLLIEVIDVDVTDGSLYVADASRGGKLLSTSEFTYTFSERNNADGIYLRPAGTIISTTRGFRLPKNATLIGIMMEGEGNLSKEFQLQKDTVSLGTLALVGGVYNDMTLNHDFDAGEVVQLFVTDFDDPVQNTIATLYFKWRK